MGETTPLVTLITHTPEPEKVIACAAKLCYSQKSGAVLNYDMTLEEAKEFLDKLPGSHCYDEETEVLTSKGFIPFRDLQYNNYVAVVNPDTMELKGFENPLDIIKNQYNGKMFYIDSKKVNMCVTPNHKLYCARRMDFQRNGDNAFELVKAENVYDKTLRMSSVAKNANHNNLFPTTALAELIGFIIGDGYINKNNGISFHLKKSRKVKYLSKLCDELDIHLVTREYNEYFISYHDNKNIIPENLRGMLYNSFNEKTFPYEFFKMSKLEFDSFIEGLMNSDGHYAGRCKNDKYHTASKELAERLQALCTINHRPTTIIKKDKVKDFYGNIDNKERVCYHCYIGKESRSRPYVNDSRNKDSKIQTVDYNGMIYCCTVSTGLIITRRNGKTLLCGNSSPFEHATFTFSIEGVSRALSHELVRHRMANHNQRSQRYVMEGSFNYVIPEVIKGNTHTAVPFDYNDDEDDFNTHLSIEEVFEYAMGSAKDYYDILLNALKESGIPEKVAFENARYVLPNACETKNMLTMNVRELHHFFNQRCCSRALPEMRKVANQMLAICKRTSPILFKDAGPFCVSGACPEANMSCGKQREMKEFYGNL